MYTDITSTEKALEKLGLDPNSKPEITGISEKHAKILSAVYESLVISEAIREEWEPDYDNQTEKKFEPWYWADAPGFRFHGSHCTHTRTIAALGPLLCQESREKSDFLGKHIAEIFKPIHNPKTEK